MNQFTSYAPPDVLNETLSQELKDENRWEGGSTMVLDAITLRNLRIVQDEGCLYERLNFCSTHMGKRFVNLYIKFASGFRYKITFMEACPYDKNIIEL